MIITISKKPATLDALEISKFATGKVKADKLLASAFKENEISDEIKKYNRVFSISVGKASYTMHNMIEKLIVKDKLIASLIITNSESDLRSSGINTTVIESSHPYPTEKSLLASQEIISFIRNNEISDKDLLILKYS